MIKGVVIQLAPDLYDEACELGRARYENNRQHGVLKNDIKGVDPVHGDSEGVAGELAFAQLVDADPAQWAEIRRIGVTSAAQGTDKGDVTFQGRCIDVKTTTYDSGHLLVYAHKLDNAQIDGYALLTGHKGRYTFRGYISRLDIIDGVEAGRFTMQSRNTYWIDQDALHDLPERHAELALDDSALLIDGCDRAIVGTHYGRAVYSYDLLIEHFMHEFSDLDHPSEAAVEWVAYNVERGIDYLDHEHAPLIINLTAVE